MVTASTIIRLSSRLIEIGLFSFLFPRARPKSREIPTHFFPASAAGRANFESLPFQFCCTGDMNYSCHSFFSFFWKCLETSDFRVAWRNFIAMLARLQYIKKLNEAKIVSFEFVKNDTWDSDFRAR
jgi:hypothetical protein